MMDVFRGEVGILFWGMLFYLVGRGRNKVGQGGIHLYVYIVHGNIKK